MLLAMLMVMFMPIFPDMFRVWLRDSSNSHCLLVPLISLYLIYLKRQKIQRQEAGPSSWGIMILAGSLVVYLLSYVGGIDLFARLSLVSSLIGLVFACWGWKVLRCLFFPLMFLFFMVPVPDSLVGLVSFPLQIFATKVSAWLIGALSIPVVREGNMLYFVQTQLEVAQACSGIRSMVSMLMLGFLLAYMSNQGWWGRTLLLISAIPIAVIANIVRVSGTGVLAHYLGDEVARGFLHGFSGMVVFAFGLGLLVLEFWALSAWKGKAGGAK